MHTKENKSETVAHINGIRHLQRAGIKRVELWTMHTYRKKIIFNATQIFKDFIKDFLYVLAFVAGSTRAQEGLRFYSLMWPGIEKAYRFFLN